MRCKPGDLAAVIVSTDDENIGRLVRVVRRAYDGEIFLGVHGNRVRLECEGLASWAIEASAPMVWNTSGHFIERAFADNYLRPIRDPGEDARDETLTWLPVPTKETA